MQGVILSSGRLTDIHSGRRFCEVCEYGEEERNNVPEQTKEQTALLSGARERDCLSLHFYYIHPKNKTRIYQNIFKMQDTTFF